MDTGWISPWPRYSGYVHAYAEAIERDFNGEPVTLIGHSTGGFISLLLARHRPDLVSSVILMGAFACGRFEGQERLASHILRIPLLGRHLFIRLFARWIATRETFRWGSLDCVFDKSADWETEETIAAMEQVREHLLKSEASEIASFVSWMSRTSVIDGLPFVDVPVLNIIGARDAIAATASDPSLRPPAAGSNRHPRQSRSSAHGGSARQGGPPHQHLSVVRPFDATP